ncbi:putative acetyltransferase [Pseudomonas sp. SORGH_AS199]|uniref:GNAT family N-acetyltransferase n=1 Tax=Pseudomonas sp. SORGH_AS_0199 TaxID=3041761 RepID=UPI0028563882|nr:GNAT family N-acetyltransferase [Pseudomonas sp. SORGH_AS_0199]MDR6229610.1 putative acetyltransferase [Pseudomonas sp. SORGH_AS_0199]
MSSSLVHLERYADRHAEGLAALYGDPVVARQVLQLPYQTAEQWRQRQSAEREGRVTLVALQQGRVVGSASLEQQPRIRRQHCGAIGMGVARDCQGQGIGTQLLTALLDLADNWMNLQRVELTVFSDNEPALALYRKLGFEEEGLLRRYALRDGVFTDVYSMARFKP